MWPSSRIKRHNAISNYISRSLQQKGFQVTEDIIFPLPAGTLKPDLVTNKNNTALLLDAQIVGDGVELDSSHTAKCARYNIKSIEPAVKVQTDAQKVIFSSIMVNWRGFWPPKSAHLLRLDVIRKKSLIHPRHTCHYRLYVMSPTVWIYEHPYKCGGKWSRTGVG
ncbi:Retrovirus-related Pol polyprotein type-2 like protein [Argiope bruennichi]|uniref:Retrovirus-related Pol polyprotein type-2 like protein n=1 Tax=Argiope bruennichi TaxID=94029 RepID=A0A8T0FDC4_ARGBR|nr:Retrovirus-related Pol polyprotein type-2 like protein [Argiope bruennichi]